MKNTQKSAKSTTAVDHSDRFTDEERAAMKERVQELKAAARRGPRADEESAVLAKIAELPEPDRAVAERFGAARNSQHERGKSSRVLVGLDVARSLRSRNDDVSNSSRVWKVWRASAAMAGSVQVQ